MRNAAVLPEPNTEYYYIIICILITLYILVVLLLQTTPDIFRAAIGLA